MVHALRSMGSAAMNFTQVAMGGLDLYWYVTTPVTSILERSLVSAGRSGVGTWPTGSKSLAHHVFPTP